jgi:MarR family transcriptional regulator, transcriptional regulator for hemolysin
MSIAASGSCQTQAAIAERLGLDRTAMTHLVDGLEAKKLVKRIPDSADRRARHVALTAKGAAVLAQMTERVAHIENRLLSGLADDEAEQLRTILVNVANQVDAGIGDENACQMAESLDVSASACDP